MPKECKATETVKLLTRKNVNVESERKDEVKESSGKQIQEEGGKIEVAISDTQVITVQEKGESSEEKQQLIVG